MSGGSGRAGLFPGLNLVFNSEGICLYGAFQCQADFTSPISYTVVREQLLVARRPTVIGRGPPVSEKLSRV